MSFTALIFAYNHSHHDVTTCTCVQDVGELEENKRGWYHAHAKNFFLFRRLEPVALLHLTRRIV